MGMLIGIIFGWPAVFASLALGAYGIIKAKITWLIGAFILFSPFAFYLSGTPRFRSYALLLPLFYLGAAVALKFRSKVFAGLCLLPLASFVLWFGLIVQSH